MSHEPTISGSVTIGFDKVILNAEGSPQDMFKRVGLSDCLLDDPYEEIPLRSFINLLEHAASLTQANNIGLRFGDSYNFEDLGPIGYAVMHSPTLGAALKYFSQTLCAIQDDSELEFSVTDNIAAFKYRVLDLSIWPRRQDAEFSIALFTKIIRSALGNDWRPSTVHFEHSPPLFTNDHRRFFRAPVHFNMPTNAFYFPASQLDRPMKPADPKIMQHAFRQLDNRLETHRHSLSFIETVNRATMAALLEGDHRSGSVAAKLGMSGRTFNRRLGERDLTYRDIISFVRAQMARNLLSQRNISITETAYLLGYSDLSAFNRAFKSWTGTNPTSFRSENTLQAPLTSSAKQN